MNRTSITVLVAIAAVSVVLTSGSPRTSAAVIGGKVRDVLSGLPVVQHGDAARR